MRGDREAAECWRHKGMVVVIMQDSGEAVNMQCGAMWPSAEQGLTSMQIDFLVERYCVYFLILYRIPLFPQLFSSDLSLFPHSSEGFTSPCINLTTSFSLYHLQTVFSLIFEWAIFQLRYTFVFTDFIITDFSCGQTHRSSPSGWAADTNRGPHHLPGQAYCRHC